MLSLVSPAPLLPVTPFAAHPYTGLHHRLLFTEKELTTLSGQIVNLNEVTQMNNKSITPNPQQPVDRIPTGQLPSALAELSEATLSHQGVVPGKGGGTLGNGNSIRACSYDGDDE
jgi:bacteriocin leader peptide (microcyclamide/patellamide family)